MRQYLKIEIDEKIVQSCEKVRGERLVSEEMC